MSITVNEQDLWEMMMFDALHSTITVKDVIDALRRAKQNLLEKQLPTDGVDRAAKEICQTISEKIPGFCISCFDHAYSKQFPTK